MPPKPEGKPPSGPRKIALVGTAPSSKFAPFSDPSYEIWGVGARGAHVTRLNRFYEVHRLSGEDAAWAEDWRDGVRQWITDEVDLLMFYPEPGLAKNTKRFPIEQIAARFGTFFMTSSFAWMIAHAIDEMCPKVKGRLTFAEPGSEIGVWGADMEYGTEYREQRTGVRHFLELAEHLGITVRRVASGGLVYEPVPYPLWQDDPLLCKLSLRNQETAVAISQSERGALHARDQLNAAKGSLAEVDLMIRAGEPMPEGEEPNAPYVPADRRSALEKQVKDLEDASLVAVKSLVHWQAIDSEQKWLKDYLMP